MHDPEIDRLRAALARDPASSALHKNLAVLLWQSGRTAEARDALAHAVTILPEDASLWARLARVLVDLGDAARSAASLQRAVQAQPRDAATWMLIGSLHAEAGRWTEAQPALAAAAALEPGAAEIEMRLAHAAQETGDMPQAMEALDRGIARSPRNLNLAVDHALALPQIYSSVEDLADWRDRYASGLDDLQARIDEWKQEAPQALELNHHNFLLAYQGGDDLPLQRGYSRFLGQLALRARSEWASTRAPDFDGGRRLRVGFVGNIFRDCTAGRYFERWITGLDPARFERFVYHTAPVVDDFTRRISAGCEHFIPLRMGNVDAATRIAADRLDVLVQPEVGMTPLSYLLAALRLAPVQVAGWGHPITTGSANVDYYFTAGPMEPADGASHYVEQLVPLPGLGVDYAMPPVGAAFTRAALGLADGKHAYVCPQSLFKVHPDMDALLARIAATDEDAVLLFFQAPSRAVTEQFARRLQRALEDADLPPRGQVKFLPRMSSTDFRRLLAGADVVVDSVHWSGGNTSLDALAAGTPIVTLPGRFMRGRQSAAMLGTLGLQELVAADADDYVRLAIEVASDRARNQALRRAIVGRRGELFGRREPIVAFENALLSIASGARP